VVNSSGKIIWLIQEMNILGEKGGEWELNLKRRHQLTPE
jgi:hypothetical protein